jgi:acyl dehydratase
MPRFAQVGERFERTVRIDAEAIRAFAAASLDFNPLHHDEDAARRSRFGGLIASGPHTAALLMGITATHFAARCAPLGLDFRLQFRKAVRAGDTLRLAWTVTRVEAKESLDGELVHLEGSAHNDAGELALAATGLLLLRASA